MDQHGDREAKQIGNRVVGRILGRLQLPDIRDCVKKLTIMTPSDPGRFGSYLYPFGQQTSSTASLGMSESPAST